MRLGVRQSAAAILSRQDGKCLEQCLRQLSHNVCSRQKTAGERENTKLNLDRKTCTTGTQMNLSFAGAAKTATAHAGNSATKQRHSGNRSLSLTKYLQVQTTTRTVSDVTIVDISPEHALTIKAFIGILAFIDLLSLIETGCYWR